MQVNIRNLTQQSIPSYPTKLFVLFENIELMPYKRNVFSKFNKWKLIIF